MNHVILIGFVGADPEMRQTHSGKAVCNFRIATNSRTKDGEELTSWHRIVCWERTAEVCGEHLRKGQRVAVAGRIQSRTYEDKDGKTRSATEVVAHIVNFLDRRPEQGDSKARMPSASGRTREHRLLAPDDALPF